jgi:predicted helicase
MQAFETMTELMPWQEAAVNKLKPTRVGGLFMEMGTGKTLTAIEIIKQRAHKIDKVVWFCPVSLKSTIFLEILKHTDAKDIYVFDEKTTSRNIPNMRWYIIGIESMSSSNRVVFAAKELITDKTFVILDESSYIKGHRAKRTERIILLAEKG